MLSTIFGGLWSRIFGGLAVAALLFAGVQTYRLERCQSRALSALKQAEKQRARNQSHVETQATELEKERAHVIDRSPAIRTIYETIEVPADCAPDPGAVQLLEQSRIDANRRVAGVTGE